MTKKTKRDPVTTRGTVVTDELADQIAEEAEAGYDLSKARRGRPSLAGAAGKSPRINVRLAPDVYARARERAERENKTVSQLAREALERHVAS